MTEKTLISLDYAIKYLLKDKNDYEIVEGFISAVLKDAGYSAVKITALLESESNKERRALKKSVADVIVEDQQGHKYIVEIDRSITHTFLHKACFNSCRLIVDNINSDQDYKDIKKIFHINLIYFLSSNIDSPLYHGQTIFRKMDNEHPVDLHLADMRLRFFDIYNIFPEYFIISVPLFNDVIKDELDEWLYFAKHCEVKDDFKSPYMKKVAKRLSVLKMTPEERRHYQSYVNENLKERDYMVAALEEQKIKIAKKMLAKGKSIDEIIEFTELPVERIELLKE
ncbi:PD-(D/E)XK nuclease family transposase [Candidatus Tisiphia endosymbiont of Micropterix aruncella]|uniref:PD-(D/E)XK nuclease family transposase n=1 Tax=Candidatus Tisiphia endosymbiont of Micropterix aruncella TaxID=3066271 RepID=UPI003AA87447